MKTNLNPMPEMEEDPVVLERIDREVLIARREYKERLERIKRDQIKQRALKTREMRT